MRYLNKKGLSEIVSVVLLLMLTVAAVSFLFGIFNNLLAPLAPQYNCIEGQINGDFEITQACYNDEQQVVFTLKRSFAAESQVNYIEFTVTSNEDSVKYGCGARSNFECGTCVLPAFGQEREYTLTTESLSGPPLLVSASAETCLLNVQDITPCQ